MTRNVTRNLIGIFGSLAIASAASAAPVNYNFDALTPGAMAVNATPGGVGNQDGWYLDSAITTSVPVAATAASGSPTTQVMTNAQGAGTRAIKNFGTAFFTGTETNAQYSFTFQKNSGTWAISMALAGNGTAGATNGNALVQFGPRFGLAEATKFFIAPKNNLGAWAAATTSTAQTMTTGNWYTVTAIIDFTANAGDGLGSITLRDITANTTPVTVMSNVALGLNASATDTNPNQWNQVWFRADPSGGTLLANSIQISSFTVGVPEPATLGLMALGGLMLCFRR
ncbi:MAG: PEP-CTERM sorting domain-containing protein [Phycisphaeraceae bacterium]